MAEPCDPEVLHARLAVVENELPGIKREIIEHRGTIHALQICIGNQDDMRVDLKEIKTELKALTEFKNMTERADQNSFWDSTWGDRLWNVAVTVLTVVAVILSAAYLHIFTIG